MKRISLYIVLGIAIFAQSAFAGLLLPTSSHYEGRLYFNTSDNRAGKIEFAVYDTQTVNEFTSAGFNNAPGVGRYIYTYQIFCDTATTNPIDFFSILGIGEGALVQPKNNNIGASNDNVSGSIAPTDAFTPYNEDWGDIGTWEFAGNVLTGNKQSWFLVLRSNQDWTKGQYSFDPNFANSDMPIPTKTPEPTTMAIFGIGLVSLLLRNKKASGKTLSR